MDVCSVSKGQNTCVCCPEPIEYTVSCGMNVVLVHPKHVLPYVCLSAGTSAYSMAISKNKSLCSIEASSHLLKTEECVANNSASAL